MLRLTSLCSRALYFILRFSLCVFAISLDDKLQTYIAVFEFLVSSVDCKIFSFILEKGARRYRRRRAPKRVSA